MTATATIAQILAIARSEEAPDGRVAAAAGLLEQGVPFEDALDKAMGRLARQGLQRPRRTDAPQIWAAYGQELARTGRTEIAAAALDLALSLDPAQTSARLDRATLAFQTADLTTAHAHFSRILDASAADTTASSDAPAAAVAAHEGLAAIAARSGDGATARHHSEAALAGNPASMPALLASARADLLDGAPAQASARVRAALEAAPTAQAAVPLLDIAAEAHEALGQPDEAFAAWARRNRLLQQALPPLPQGVERPADRAARVADWIEGQPVRAGPPPPPIAGTPVFLVGFPRSGTTLLEKALAGHPDIQTLEEVETLETVLSPMMAPDALAALPAMDPGVAARARSAWGAGAASACAPAPLGPVVIDKMPLSTVLLPAIAQVWPGARVLLAIRDPRDVVLSCFRTRFRPNPAMAEFLDLHRAAAFYDSVQRIAAARDRLALDVRIVRHEQLVADFAGEIGQTLAFLGLDWDDGVRDFADRAAARAVTPSDMQLRRGLSADRIGTWRAHAQGLAPIRPILDGWARRYGYPTD